MQVIGTIIEFKGKTAPGILNLKKIWAQRKQEKAASKKAAEILPRVETMLASIEKHYSDDNISMRDEWIRSVNESIAESNARWKEVSKTILSILIDNKRSAILNFASRVSDENCLATREEFNRVFKIHKEYEDLITENGLTNGEVDIAIRVIREAYELRLRNHSFVEDVRGYNT